MKHPTPLIKKKQVNHGTAGFRFRRVSKFTKLWHKPRVTNRKIYLHPEYYGVSLFTPNWILMKINKSVEQSDNEYK